MLLRRVRRLFSGPLALLRRFWDWWQLKPRVGRALPERPPSLA